MLAGIQESHRNRGISCLSTCAWLSAKVNKQTCCYHVATQAEKPVLSLGCSTHTTLPFSKASWLQLARGLQSSAWLQGLASLLRISKAVSAVCSRELSRLDLLRQSKKQCTEHLLNSNMLHCLAVSWAKAPQKQLASPPSTCSWSQPGAGSRGRWLVSAGPHA